MLACHINKLPSRDRTALLLMQIGTNGVPQGFCHWGLTGGPVKPKEGQSLNSQNNLQILVRFCSYLQMVMLRHTVLISSNPAIKSSKSQKIGLRNQEYPTPQYNFFISIIGPFGSHLVRPLTYRTPCWSIPPPPGHSLLSLVTVVNCRCYVCYFFILVVDNKIQFNVQNSYKKMYQKSVFLQSSVSVPASGLSNRWSHEHRNEHF